jgi:hypothetical protein
MYDKTQMLNTTGIGLESSLSKIQERELLFQAANHNTAVWTNLLWLSGGTLNPNKCFFYFIKPIYDFNLLKVIYETSRSSPGTIYIDHPATGIRTDIERREPKTAKRTLGAIIAPNGNGKAQILHTYTKTCEYIGKIKHSKLSNTAKWTAITTVLEPGVLYPMMACIYDTQDIQKSKNL